MKKPYLMPLIFILLTACQSLGLQTPETFNEKASAAIVSVTAVRKSALTLLQAGVISSDDAQNVQAQADNARTGIDIARTIHATDPAAAENRITAVLVGLNVLSAYLATQEK